MSMKYFYKNIIAKILSHSELLSSQFGFVKNGLASGNMLYVHLIYHWLNKDGSNTNLIGCYENLT